LTEARKRRSSNLRRKSGISRLPRRALPRLGLPQREIPRWWFSWCSQLHRRCGHRTMTITYPLDMYPGRQASDGRSYLVQRAEKLALAYVDKPLQVSALSRAIGVSERTLRKLFNEIHGRPPSRHLRMLRLSQVRGALLSARGQLVTVTEIATAFGFAELGRFSVEYRKVFGESPSETLHQAHASSRSSAGCARNRISDLTTSTST
jgi:AraC-like DNA-binding protein